MKKHVFRIALYALSASGIFALGVVSAILFPQSWDGKAGLLANLASSLATVAATLTALYFGYKSISDSKKREDAKEKVAAAVLLQPIFSIIVELEDFERYQNQRSLGQRMEEPSAAAIATARLERLLTSDPLARMRLAVPYFTDTNDRIVTFVLLLEATLVRATTAMQLREKGKPLEAAPHLLLQVKNCAVRAAHYLWLVQYPRLEQPWRSRFIEPDVVTDGEPSGV